MIYISAFSDDESLIDGQVHLRSKRELIEKFWEDEKESASDALCKEVEW